jgi:CubicO group peptidase (beta-lactamase class C family)
LASLEYRIPLRSTTVFHVASLSKQFTGMGIVLLEQEGALRFDDPVGRYLPWLTDVAGGITIDQLLHHTSGLRDQTELVRMAGWHPETEELRSRRTFAEVIRRQNSLNHPPGEQFVYSNSNYDLLGLVIEAVSGESYPDFIRQRIFEPLGMTDSQVPGDIGRIVSDRARAYRETDGGYRTFEPMYDTYGATGLLTTVEDLAKWVGNFREPRVGGEAGLARLVETAPLNSGERTAYARGINTWTHRGVPLLAHAGNDGAYTAHVIVARDEPLAIIVLANGTGTYAWDVSLAILDTLLAERLGPADPEDADDDEAEEGALTADERAALRLSDFEGSYVSDELETRYRVRVDEPSGALEARVWGRHDTLVELTPTAPDAFKAGTGYYRYRFARDESGRVVRLLISSGRAWDVSFARED